MPSTSKKKVIWLVILSVSKNLPPEKVGFGMGLINATIGIGITIALLATPIISEIIEWRVTFLFTSLACGALFLYSLLLIKQEKAIRPIGAENLPDSEASYSFGKLLSNPMLMLIAISMGSLFIEVYGAILATYLGGYLLTSTGNYDVSLIVFAIASALAGAIIFTGCQMISSNPPEHFATIEVV